MTLRVHAGANGELIEALVWLVKRHRYEVAGRLDRLWEAALERIQFMPRAYPVVDDPVGEREIRNFLLPRYGYRVVYELTGDEIHVLAFARGQRNSGPWHDRITDS